MKCKSKEKENLEYEWGMKEAKRSLTTQRDTKWQHGIQREWTFNELGKTQRRKSKKNKLIS